MTKNIYQMYQENGWKTGFWVRRENWGNTVALVKLIAGEETGKLAGQPPYFSLPGKGSPKVICDVFNEMTGERIDPDSQLSCPGTYSYRKVEPPTWIETDPMKISAQVGKRPGEQSEMDPKQTNERIYLKVPFIEKETAKNLGARWDSEKKSWFIPEGMTEAPFQRWLGGTSGTKDSQAIEGLNRRPHPIVMKKKIGLDLIPETAWFSNAREFLSEEVWKTLHNELSKKNHFRCECCDGQGLQHPVEVHERWAYDQATRVQSLIGFSVLCPACHEVCHFGLARVKGRDGIAIQHLQQVNGWSEEEAQDHIKAAFDVWKRRSKIEWSIDLDLIERLGLPKPVIAPKNAAKKRQHTPKSGLNGTPRSAIDHILNEFY